MGRCRWRDRGREKYPLVDLNHCYRVEKTQRPRPLDEGGTDDFESEPKTVNIANAPIDVVFPDRRPIAHVWVDPVGYRAVRLERR